VSVGGVLSGDGAAGHEQHVRVRDVGERLVDAQMHEVVVVIDHARAFGADDRFRARQVREDLLGTDCVKRRESLVEADGDDHDGHCRRTDHVAGDD
jgi:hypothetical protein